MSTGRQQVSGLTRADVLTVLALGALLLVTGGRLTSKPREQAGRMLCRANLGMIGRAMFLYASDFEDLPRAGGGPEPEWGPVVWNADNRATAYNVRSGLPSGEASISSCFYLLVKYLEMPTRLFVCPGDIGTSPFELAEEDASTDFELTDAWDFGAVPYDNCSYTYHTPFSMYALTQASDPNLPVAADRNPWIKSPAFEPDPVRYANFIPDIPNYPGTVEDARRGNANVHEGDGQNVLFLDGRVAFEHRSYCGVDYDNIYTRSVIAKSADPRGAMPVVGSIEWPANEKDSLLLHDPGVHDYGIPRRR